MIERKRYRERERVRERARDLLYVIVMIAHTSRESLAGTRNMELHLPLTAGHTI